MFQRAFQRFFRMFFSLVLLLGLCLPVKAAAYGSAFELFFPSMLIRNANFSTNLQLMNLGSSEATVIIDLAGPSGAASLSRSIQPGNTLLVTEDDFPSLTGGLSPFRAIVTSSQPLDGVMAFFRKTGTPGLVSLLRGAPGGGGGIVVFKLFFGPVYHNSSLSLLNTSPTSAAMVVELYNAAGSVAYTGHEEIPALASITVNLASQPVPAGTYLAVVSSSQPLTGMVQNIEQLPWGTQMRFRGPLQPGSPALLARALKAVSDSGGARTSRIFTANLGIETGTFIRALHNQSGGVSDSSSFNLPTMGYRIEDLASLTGLADGTSYSVSTAGTNVAVSDMTEYNASPGNYSFASYSTDVDVLLPLPRLVKGAGSGSVIRILNTASSPANLVINLQQTGGSSFSITKTAPPNGWAQVDLRSEASIPASFTGGGLVSADQPVTALVDEFYLPPCISPAVTISHTPVGTLYPSNLVEFSATATGDAPLSYAWMLDGVPAGTDSATYSTSLAEGGHTIDVTVTNACGTDSASEWVTVSPPPCLAPTVTLAHTPSGVLYPGDLIHFTTTTTGTAPLSYAWTVDSAPAGTNSPTFDTSLPVNTHAVGVTVSNACGNASALETVFISCVSPTLTMSMSPAGVIYPTDTIHFTTATSGTPPFSFAWLVDSLPDGTNSPTFDKSLPAGNHYVNASVTNACGVYSHTRAFTVVQPALPAADLSRSTLNASTAGASAGDRIQFIAVLRNTGSLAAPGSLFVNQIPGYTAYVTGSAHASDGSLVAYDGTSLTWTGNLEPGSPVVIMYEVTVTSQPPDNMIHNSIANLYDHLNNVTSLTSNVRFVPGYSLKINDGAVGTNTLAVNLVFTYNPADGPVSYQLSNNAAFDAQGSASAWLDLDAGQNTHPGWEIDPLGDPRLPRTVYIRYRKANAQIVGPFMASILYDVQAPAEPQLSLPQNAGQFSASLAGMQLTAVTSDDNSGVAVIQLSQHPDFSSEVTTIQVTGRVTTFTWSPSEPGPGYIRALDRSGNASNAGRIEGQSYVFLPMIRR